MGKSESAKECKRHPNHNQLPGICPSCLREKLQQFHDSSIYSHPNSTSSDFLFSPRRRRHHHRRNASEIVSGSSTTATADLFGDKLKKTGSIGILTTAAAGGGGGKKKSGFWSRLLVRPKALYFHSQPKVSREILG